MTMPDLGEFIAGEKPAAGLLHTFKDAAGQPINISGYQVKFSYREQWDTSAATRDGAVANGPAGQASYAWDGTEFAHAGRWVGELWAGNGVVRLSSYWTTWTVRAAVGAVPSI